MKSLSLLFYAINGTGAGHITRCVTLATEVKVLLNAIGYLADIHLLTTSECDIIGIDFPVWKIPSRTRIANSDTNNSMYLRKGSFFVNNLVVALGVKTLVVDTLPQGSFNEFIGLRQQVNKAIFINRHKKEEVLKSESSQACLNLYDMILTPDMPDQHARYVFEGTMAYKNRYIENVHGYKPFEAMNREQVCNQFGIKPEQKIIYVSSGGGGDKNSVAYLQLMIDELSKDPNNFLLVGYGLLYNGPKVYKANVIPLCEPNVRKYFGGIDMAFSAAGYNSFEELLSAQVPTAFYPLEKGFDLQDERIIIASKQNLCFYIDELDSGSIYHAYRMLKTSKGKEIKEALSKRKFCYGATIGGFEIIKQSLSPTKNHLDYCKLLIAKEVRVYYYSQFAKWNNISFEFMAKAVIKLLSTTLNENEFQYLMDSLSHGEHYDNRISKAIETVISENTCQSQVCMLA